MKHLFILLLFLFPIVTKAQQNFEQEPDTPHYLVVLPKAGWANMADMVGGFAKYNAKKYTEKKLTIKQYRLTKEDKMPFVLVGTFENEIDAVIYFQALKTPLATPLSIGRRKSS